jgi:hypothetical protein
MKKEQRGKRFGKDNELKSSAEQSFYLKGIEELQKRWTKCIDVGGDYVEKC